MDSIEKITAQYYCNYEEEKVPKYVLPEIIPKLPEGTSVKEYFESTRKQEILKCFEAEVFGEFLSTEDNIAFEVLHEKEILCGKALQRQVKFWPKKEDKDVYLNLIIFIPINEKKPSPVFVNLNFRGNHTISNDEDIFLHEGYVREYKSQEKNDDLSESLRGSRSPRYPIEKIIDKGFSLVTACYEEILPDNNEWFEKSLNRLKSIIGKTQKEDTSAINIWAWALTKMMDYVELDDRLDSKNTIVAGHSRLGKAAIWAGVNDTRFKMVVSNDSGCMGAAISRRCFGETIETVTLRFPHWFRASFGQYANNEEKLPVDQHSILSLVAPRLLCVASASGDQWADPKGEFLGAYHASQVYEYYGSKGFVSKKMPEVNSPVDDGSVHYHIRKGEHSMLEFDWNCYMNFYLKNIT
jgi:hypothetical protein